MTPNWVMKLKTREIKLWLADLEASLAAGSVPPEKIESTKRKIRLFKKDLLARKNGAGVVRVFQGGRASGK